MPNTEFFALSGAWIIANVWAVLVALLVLVAGWMIARFASRNVVRLLPANLHRDQTIVPLVSQVLRYAILVVTVIIVLGQFGVQTASILAVLGAAGLAIALALQGTLSNIAAGILLVLLRPFNVGDSIDADGIAGTVVEIGLFATQMRNGEGVFMFVPNSKLSNARIINFNRAPARIVEIRLNLPRSTDFAHTRRILLEAARADYVLGDPAPQVLLDTVSDSTITLVLRAAVRSQEWATARSDLQERVRAAVDTASQSGTLAPA